MLKCAHCDKRFKYESERKRHQESHIPQFGCKVCAKKFSFLSALRRHQKQHERTGTVRCNDCGGSFRDETLLKRHMQYAHKGSYSCPECLAMFSSEQALRTHSNIHKPEAERKFRCIFPGCKKTFNFPHHLKHHELTHTKAKQHFCNVCEKGFIQSHHLKTHFKTHHPKNWLYCTVPDCKNKFTTKHAWKKHISTHNTYEYSNGTDTKLDSGVSSDSSPAIDVHNKNDAAIEDNQKCDTTTLKCTTVPQDIARCSNLEDTLLKHDTGFEIQDTSNNTYQVTSGTYMDIADVEINKICNNITMGLKVNFAGNCDDSVTTTCASCRCSDRLSPSRVIDQATLRSKKLRSCKINNLPEIEYRKDGIIKIKETFDTDIVIVNPEPAKVDCKDTIEPNDLRFVPYNSCKAVLGNCIVSDDGSVGEECLCAKMLIEEQVSAQEIEELTPDPHGLWL